MSVRMRFARSFAAQIYSQISSIVVQLALVPVLLHAWGTTLYGTWLLLSAVPFYLTFSDFGFTFIAKNEMVMAVGASNRPAAVRTFQSVFVMLSCLIPAAFLVMAVPAFGLDLNRLLSLHGFPNGQARLVFMLLVANVALYQYFLLISAGIRAENRPASEAMMAATARLVEGLLLAAVALLGGMLVAAAVAVLVNRVLFLVGGYVWMRRLTPWLTIGWGEARMAEIRRLFHPALAYMFMPLAQAMIIQGPLLIIGHVLNPLSVVIFSTSRTLARLGTAASNLLMNAFVTEYAARAGQGDLAGFRRIYRMQLLTCGGAALAYTAGILLLAKPLMQVFTHGKVPVVEPFFALIVAGVVAEMVWVTQFSPVSAVNRHRVITYSYFGLAIVGILVSYPLTRLAGIEGMAMFVLGVNAAMIPVNALFGRTARLFDGHAERVRAAFAG